MIYETEAHLQLLNSWLIQL